MLQMTIHSAEGHRHTHVHRQVTDSERKGDHHSHGHAASDGSYARHLLEDPMLDPQQLQQYKDDLNALQNLAPLLSELTAQVLPSGQRYDQVVWNSFFSKYYDNATMVPPGLVQAAKLLRGLQYSTSSNQTDVHSYIFSAIQFVGNQRSPEGSLPPPPALNAQV
jgi:hypothetical protein